MVLGATAKRKEMAAVAARYLQYDISDISFFFLASAVLPLSYRLLRGYSLSISRETLESPTAALRVGKLRILLPLLTLQPLLRYISRRDVQVGNQG